MGSPLTLDCSTRGAGSSIRQVDRFAQKKRPGRHSQACVAMNPTSPKGSVAKIQRIRLGSLEFAESQLLVRGSSRVSRNR